ncbi:phage terminase large subunit family protein [Rhizobium ruizarguesonis]
MYHNDYLTDFRSQLRQRFAEDSINMSMSEYIVKNTHLRKRQFSFKGYEFQQQIVDDMHPDLWTIKCSQIGLTEVQLRKFAAFLARTTAVKAIFSLPTDVMFKRVSQTRFSPLISDEPVFNMASVDKPVRSVGLYQINQSFGFFTGGKESDATSIDADALFQDEIDLADQEMLALYQSRLQGSDYKITQSFSTPTFEGYGVHAGFKTSDQHEYVLKCEGCNHYNIPEFTPKFITIPGLSSDLNDLSEIDSELADKLDLRAGYIRCESCGRRLNTADPSLRSWVPRFPGRRSRGYRVSPFCVHRIANPEYIVDQLVKYKKRDALRRWYNTVLGEAFNDASARLSEVDILAVMKGEGTPEINKMDPVMIGIDAGLTCHITLANVGQAHPVIFSFRQVSADNLLDEVKTILETYNVVGGCMDRNPYTPLANEIRDLSQGRIMPVQYASAPGAAAMQFVHDELEQLSHLVGNRTTMLDAVAGAIRKRKLSMYGYGRHQRIVLDHLQDMVRIDNEVNEKTKDEIPARWQKLNGNDHFFHALAYLLFAMRVNTAIDFRQEDPRTQVTHANIIIPMGNASRLGMQRGVQRTISLGLI